MASTRITFARYICLGLYFFLCGVEYAVILPSINIYLLTLQADETFLGIVLASFSFAGLIGAPLYGLITDKTGSTKACIVAGNLFEIVGNFLYFVGTSKYLVWGGRVLAGFGSGAVSSVFGMISRSTTVKERTSMFAMLMALRQIGLLIGPGFNAFLCILDFKIGPFVVNENTSPGIFMAILWTLHTIIFLILFKDNIDPTADDLDSSLEHSSAAMNQHKQIGTNSNEVIFSEGSSFARRFVTEFLREEVIVCFAISFMAMFVQTGFETAVTPMTLMYFGWNVLSNSYLLCAAGLLVIVSFCSVHFLSKCVMDRTLLLFGCIGLLLTYAQFFAYEIVLYICGDELETPLWVLPVFCTNCAMLTISLAYLFVPQTSLFSKITSAETQAFNQGIRVVAMRTGQILGPLWASPNTTTSGLLLMSGVNFFIMCVLTLMVIGSYRRLVPPPALEISDSVLCDSSESSPLLDEAGSD